MLSLVLPLAVSSASLRAEGEEKSHMVVMDNARFTVITPNLIRLEYSKSGKFINAPSLFAVDRDTGFDGFKLEKTAGKLTIDTGPIRLVYTPNGDRFSPDNLRADIKMGRKTVEWRPGMKNTGNLGGTIRTVDGVSKPVHLGEGVLSRDGWYLQDDSKRHLYTDDWVRRRPGAVTDWYLFGYGLDFDAALKSLAAVGGPVPMPRKYALGAWYSRYWPYTQDEYMSIVDEYAKNDFPLDVMVMDMDWHKDGWTGWSWNTKLLPEPAKLLQWYHAQGLAVTLNVHPADGVGPHEDMYDAFMRDMGGDPAKKKTLLYDASNKKYLDTLFKHTHEPHEKEGVDFWWLDWQQYPFTHGVPDLGNLEWLNNYYYSWSRRNGLRGMSFSRWAGWGDHRHPIHFSGDSDTGWPMLAFMVPLTSTAGNIGAFFWSHDIGGHMGRRIPESYARWGQFGALTAALRSHSTRSPELDRRPWKYKPNVTASLRKSFHLRSELFPYIYSSANQCHEEMKPLNRAMYHVHPADEKSYRNPQQFFFGDSLLAAPIVSPGVGGGKVAAQTVWFPAGVWHNWFTGERYTAGDEVVVTADLDEFPLYARGGMPIPLQPYSPRMASAPLDKLIVRCWPGEPGKTGKYTLYEDDGITEEYLNGAFARTALECAWSKSGVVVTVKPAKGLPAMIERKRAIVIELPATKKAAKADVDGVRAKVEYDAANSINRISVPSRPGTKGAAIKVTVAPQDPKTLAKQAAARRMKAVAGDFYKSGESIPDAAVRLAGLKLRSEAIEMLLAIGGVALIAKNEAPYLYGGVEKPFFFSRPGLLDGNSCSVTVMGAKGGAQAVLFTEKRKVDGKPFAIPVDFPADSPERIVSVEFKIKGRPFKLEKVFKGLPAK